MSDIGTAMRIGNNPAIFCLDCNKQLKTKLHFKRNPKHVLIRLRVEFAFE